jgi:nucleoside triphosphate pyrophosphatase
VYGKPAGERAAADMLRALGGHAHTVTSGICLLAAGGQPKTAAVTTLVEFRELDDGWIEWYVASGEWQARAGGYAIQGRGAALVKRIEGDYLNVVGLPVATLLELAPAVFQPF